MYPPRRFLASAVASGHAPPYGASRCARLIRPPPPLVTFDRPSAAAAALPDRFTVHLGKRETMPTVIHFDHAEDHERAIDVLTDARINRLKNTVMKPVVACNMRIESKRLAPPRPKSLPGDTPMSVMPTTVKARMVAMSVQMITYFIAAIYTHFTETHHDVCPFYACTAIITLFSLIILCVEEKRRACGMTGRDSSFAAAEAQTNHGSSALLRAQREPAIRTKANMDQES